MFYKEHILFLDVLDEGIFSMLFSSYTFLFLFLPAAVSLFYLIKKIAGERISLIFLIMVSLFFYGVYYHGFLLILIASIAFNVIIAALIEKTVTLSRLLLITGVICNLSGLIFLKLSGFLTKELGNYFPENIVALEFLFPLGIGFLTFNQISYLIAVYKNESGAEFNLDYCLRCTFFPSLVMGPVYHYKNKLFITGNNETTTAFDSVAYGIYILMIGLFKMVVLADSLYIYVFNGMNINDPGFFTAWITVLSFTLQIYFYFSGYCDMAVGIGKMFGVHLPHNFLSPYKAVSLSEFSKRWHTSLIEIIKEVVYIPITSRYSGKFYEFAAIIIASVIGSLWYGASFRVLIFGLTFGILLFAESSLKRIITSQPKLFRGGITFLIINLLFVLLGTDSNAQAVTIYKSLLNFSNFGFQQISEVAAEGSLYFPDFVNVGYFLVTIILSVVICFFGKNTKDIMKGASLTTISAIGLGLLFLIIVIHLTRLEFLF